MDTPITQQHNAEAPDVPAGGQPVADPTPTIPQQTASVTEPVNAPEPVTEPVQVDPAPQVTEPEQPQQPVQPVAYEPTGNTALDAAAKIVSEAGFDPAAVSDELNTNGKLSDQTLLALEGKLGKEQVALLASTYNTEIKKIQEKAQAEVNAVYTEVGGKETWDAIAQWTTTPESGLDKQAAQEYNAMLSAGGVQALLAAKALKEAYMASPGFTATQPNTLVTADSAVPAQPVIETISRRQYVEEKRKAMSVGDAATVAKLEARAHYTRKNVPNQWRMTPLT